MPQCSVVVEVLATMTDCLKDGGWLVEIPNWLRPMYPWLCLNLALHMLQKLQQDSDLDSPTAAHLVSRQSAAPQIPGHSYHNDLE